jgi:hypothetical protein
MLIIKNDHVKRKGTARVPGERTSAGGQVIPAYSPAMRDGKVF